MLIAAASASVACGSDADYANDQRPAAPINVTAAIGDDRVSVSPRTFGAGPIVLIVSNQSTDSQRVTLETDDSERSQPGIRQTTSPINPLGTAALQVDIPRGRYELSVEDPGIEAAALRVGTARPSAQNDLLQP